MLHQVLRARSPRKLPLLWRGRVGPRAGERIRTEGVGSAPKRHAEGQPDRRQPIHRGFAAKLWAALEPFPWKPFRWLVVLAMAGAVAGLPVLAARAWLLVDNFEQHEIRNLLGNPANIFVKGPSRVLVTRRWIPPQAGRGEEVLMLRYVKRARGGPEDAGGWCGYYTLLKSPGRAGGAEEYLDGSKYKAITFCVRGERGGEDFVVGLVDRYWDKAGDSARSNAVGAYLPAGKVTTEWQRAVVPLSEFLADFEHLSAIVFVFEGDSRFYPAAEQTGTIYIDNLALE